MAIIKGTLRPEGTNDYSDEVHLKTSADQVIDTVDKVIMTKVERDKLAVIPASVVNQLDFDEHKAENTTQAHANALATKAEAEAGLSNAKFITPATARDAINGFFTYDAGTTLIPILTSIGAGTKTDAGISASATFTKVLTLALPFKGTYRVRFGLRTAYSPATAYARIHVNGVPRGMLRSTTNSVPTVYFEEDITVNDNDLIELHSYSSVGQNVEISSVTLGASSLRRYAIKL